MTLQISQDTDMIDRRDRFTFRYQCINAKRKRFDRHTVTDINGEQTKRIQDTLG